MKYLIVSFESIPIKTNDGRNTRKGKLSVLDETEASLTDITLWESSWPETYNEMLVGKIREVEGEIIVTKKGKFTNRTLTPIKQPSYKGTPYKRETIATGIKAAQERKSEYIERAQDRKNESIAYFNAINSAIHLWETTTPKINEREAVGKEEIKDFIIYWRNWFLEEWQKYEGKDYNDKHNPF